MSASPLLRRSSNKAAALIIVLAFVVLLTGLSLAYFSSTTTDRQLAHSSYNDTSADLLARSALDIVVGDFEQEIVNGSTLTPVSGSTIYIPALGKPFVVPVRNTTTGTGGPTPIPNLIRISVSGDPGLTVTSPALGSRASAVSSTSQSANSRSISTTRWNKHCLIPVANPSTATIDNPAPTPSFTPPDWVLVTRNGPAVKTAIGSGPTALNNPVSTNGNYVIGRYAYAVYDEGGLLDINVAGYPSPTPAALPPSAPSGRDVGRKGVLAFADLTALPTTSGNFMTATDINTLIGFRNYATMQLSGVTGLNFSPFSDTAVSNFFKYFTMPSPIPASSPLQLGTSKDFGVVNTATALDARTDQNFISRAELIDFFKSTGIANVNTLQYLGTFSREQNKPCFQLTPATGLGWQFGDAARRILPQRFYLGNLNEVVNPGNAADIRRDFGLQFASAGGSCANQVRWKYVGQSGSTPLSGIPAFPPDLTTLDFFQYINYALFGTGVTNDDPTNIASTLQIGASIIDQYDADDQTTGMYYGSNPATCDLSPAINACLVYGGEGSYVSPTCISTLPPTQSIVFLNRPLRSVGEFGYAYSRYDVTQNNNSPYYLINFRNAYKIITNPDPALLDFFTYNNAPVRSGIVSLNTRQPSVLAAILKGAIYNNASSADVPLGDLTTGAIAAANKIVTATGVTRALSRADIGNLARAVSTGVNFPPFNNDDSTTGEARVTIARALSEVIQTRTWGLLIDVIAQTGHYPPNAASGPNTTNPLANFVVEGEKRYWLHIAIDRFDGTIVGQQLEEVTE